MLVYILFAEVFISLGLESFPKKVSKMSKEDEDEVAEVGHDCRQIWCTLHLLISHGWFYASFNFGVIIPDL